MILYGVSPGAWLTCTVCSDLTKFAQCQTQDNDAEEFTRFIGYIFHYVRFSCWASPEPLSTCQCHRLQAVNISV